MRIGLDFDDTLADFRTLLATETRSRFGIELTRGVRGRDIVGEERWDAFLKEILDGDATLYLDPRPGAVEVTRRLAERHELIVLTARHEHEAPHAKAWLERHRIPVAAFVTTGREAKAPLARDLGLGVHLDDTPHIFDAFHPAHPTVPALILSGSWDQPASPPAHLRMVEHWLAFEALVGDLESARR